jgi:hypothetical protein
VCITQAHFIGAQEPSLFADLPNIPIEALFTFSAKLLPDELEHYNHQWIKAHKRTCTRGQDGAAAQSTKAQ